MKRILLLSYCLSTIGHLGAQDCSSDEIHAIEDTNAVCTEIIDNVRVFYSNNYPDHEDTYSSNFELSATDDSYSMCAYPEEAEAFTPLYEETETNAGCTYNYAFGVGLNGVKYDPNSAEYFENTSTGENNISWHVEARYRFRNNFGNNGGHLNPFGEYHYHDIPSDYYANDLSIDGSQHSPIIGYAADGFPMYYKYVYSDADDANSSITELASGYSLLSGERPGDGVSAPDGEYNGLYYEDYAYSESDSELDECNGRFGVTPDYPFGTYYYVLTDNYPYIPRCFKGTYVDDTFRVGPAASCPGSSADTSCAEVVEGCMDPFSENYNPDANVDDGSCTYTTCETSISIDNQANVTCNGGNDGSITVAVTGFGDNPVYSWTDGSTDATASNLPAGTYTVTVSSDDCSESLEVTITEPEQITFTSTTTDSSCGLNDGTIELVVSGGSNGLFDFSIDGGVTFQDSGSFAELAAGDYSITIKENETDCEITSEITVHEAATPNSPEVSGNTTYCDGDEIEALTVTTGDGGTYTWYADIALTEVLTTGTSYTPDAFVGTNTYYVTETTNNCESTSSMVTVVINSLPIISVEASETNLCAGEAITLTASGATDYSWDNGVTNGESFIIEQTTTFTVTGTDSNQCSGDASITINVNPSPNIEISATSTEVCLGEAVTLTASGGSTYTWDNDIINGQTFTPEETTTYNVTGTDNNGCIGTANIQITVNSADIKANASANEICLGDQVTLTGSGASSYTWSNEVEDGVPFSPAETTTYLISGTDGNGCTGSDEITIVVNDRPDVGATASATQVCSGESIALIGSGALSYEWSNGIIDGREFEIFETTTFTVTGTNENGCTDTEEITIVVNDLPDVTATASSTEVCIGESVTLTGSGAQTYSWDNDVEDGVAFVPDATRTYTVTGIDTKGCRATAEVTVTVNDPQVVIELSGDDLVASLEGASYQWKDCQTGSSIPGAVDQTYTPTSSGSFSVTATIEGCGVTSECVDVVISGLKETIQLNYYPNPVLDKLTIDYLHEARDGLILELIDMTGHHHNVEFADHPNGSVLDMDSFASGIYLLHIQHGTNEEWIRIVKQ